MTHDMALRPGPLFMASHVSEGLLPWGAPWLLPSKLAFSSHLRPGRHTTGYTLTHTHTIHCMNSDHHKCGSMRTWLRSMLKSNRFPHGEVCLAVQHSLLPHCFTRSEVPHEALLQKYSRHVRFRPGHCQAHTASFINPYDVARDVKSGVRVRKIFGERI